MRLQRLLIAAALITAAGCGGGGAAAPTPPSEGVGLASGVLSMTFGGPATSSARRRPLFLSPSARSVSVAVTGIATNVVADVSATSSSCTTSTSGRTCQIAITAPTGSVTFTVSVYDGANATGNVLGVGSTTTTVAGSSFAVTIGVQGNVAFVRLLATRAQFAAGTPSTATLTVVASDADGNVITGTYASPITLVDGDTTGTFALSTTVVTASTQTVTLTYRGNATPAQATITASAANVPPASIAAQTLYVGTPVLPVTVYPLSSTAFPDQLAAGADGNVWFANQTTAGPQAGKFTLSSHVVSDFAIPLDPLTGNAGIGIGIVNGGDGNMYETTAECSIFRVTPSGTISTLSSVPIASCIHGRGPGLLTLGPDQAIWATEYGTVIGVIRFPLSGATPTVYIANAGGSATERFASHITVGPDKAIWFTDTGTGSSNIYRITTSGALSTFTVPTANASPEAIVTGPDGALWFTENQAAKIGRITTSGVVTEYPLPAGTVFPRALAVAKSGELYFTVSNTIGKINLAGAITLFTMSGSLAASSPSLGLDIVTGADGDFYSVVRTGTTSFSYDLIEFPQM